MCQSIFSYCNFIKKEILTQEGFPLNLARCLGVPFLQNISGWLLLFYSSCRLYTLFLFSLTNTCLPCQLRKAYAVLWAANRFVGLETPGAANRFVGLETPEHNDFDQFWKFKFHFEHFPRNTRFLSFDGPSKLYLFKNHWQTFSWPGEHPSPHLKVTKMWFSPNIKYLSKPFFVDFCCQEGISCFDCFRHWEKECWNIYQITEKENE